MVFGHQVKTEYAHAHAHMSHKHVHTVTTPRGLLPLQSRMCVEEAKQASFKGY